MKLPKEKIQTSEVSEKNWRIYILTIFVLVAAFCILARLYFLQVVRHDAFEELAENQHQSTIQILPERGEIFLRDEGGPYPVAVNKELQMAYAVPKEMEDTNSAAESLSSILSLDKGMLLEKFSDRDDMFEILKHKLNDEEVAKIKEAKISGIYLAPESFRYYPAGELAAQIIGFVGSDGAKQKGMYGVEAFWEEELKGESGMLKQESDSRGRWIPISDRNVHETRDGLDIILTINHTVQFEVEKILKATMEKFGADGGTIVVMEPKTGKILALANQPSFNPNEFSSVDDISKFLNPALSLPYECGSVFKPFTAAIGIDDGKINPDTTFTDTGVVHEAGYEIHNSDMKAYGKQTMTEVLEKSLNTGVIYIEKLVGNVKFAEYIKRFGFGEKSGIELPGEVAGNIKNLSNPRITINFYTASFGQGISVTPIQLASAFAALANDGILMKPQIIDRFRHKDGREEEVEPQQVRQVVSEDAARQVSKMLRAVVMNGHGKRADVPGYLVGGKTGTAQVAKTGAKGYEEGINIGSFAGYAPINDPQFVVLVKISNPKGVVWVESSAAPTFGEVMKFLLEYYKVKPTEDPKTSPIYKLAPVANAGQAENSSGEKEKNDKNKKKKEEKRSNSRIITSSD